MTDIENLIPHRPPFLLLDEIISLTDREIAARTALRPDDELWSRIYPGHYPGQPITPGVLLCEMVFQAGAALMSHRLRAEGAVGTPVLVRIRDARFKRLVKPGEVLEIKATFDEAVSNAYYLRGTVSVDGDLALRVAFTCALVSAVSHEQ